MHFFSNPSEPFCTHVRSICLGANDRLEILPVLRMVVQRPLYQDNSNNMQQLQGTIIMRTNFVKFLF
jgi:hypothetical protein